ERQQRRDTEGLDGRVVTLVRDRGEPPGSQGRARLWDARIRAHAIVDGPRLALLRHPDGLRAVVPRQAAPLLVARVDRPPRSSRGTRGGPGPWVRSRRRRRGRSAPPREAGDDAAPLPPRRSGRRRWGSPCRTRPGGGRPGPSPLCAAAVRGGGSSGPCGFWHAGEGDNPWSTTRRFIFRVA